LKKNAVITKSRPQNPNESLEVEMSFARDSKEVAPKLMYISVNPNSNKPEESAPRTKYFSPASVLNSESL
jgi:hypothetical protein